MTPKEKAKELYELFFEDIDPIDKKAGGEDSIAQSTAIICVNEIIKACEYNHVESNNTDWWNKVKSELIIII